jgi:CRP-like cAMP-binding protein
MAADAGRQRIARELLFAAFAGASAEGDDPRVLERIAPSVEEESVRSGHVVFRAGDESQYVHFMSEGQMRLSRPGHADWVYRGRWVVGTTDVLLGRPRARTATVETDTRLFRLPAHHWFAVMKDRPEVLLNALVGFARGVAALHTRLAPDGAFAPPPAAAAAGAGTGAAKRGLKATTLADRVGVIAALPLFRAVPVQVLVELAHVAEGRDLETDEALFGAGVPPERIFVVTRGQIEVSRLEPAVRGVFGAGSIVGGALCLGDPEAAWGARALEPSQVLSFAIDAVLDHVEEHQAGVRAMMAALALERDRLCEELASRLGELVLT